MVPQAGQVHFVFRAGGGGGGNSRPLMPRTFDSVKVKSPHKQLIIGDVVFSHNFTFYLILLEHIQKYVVFNFVPSFEVSRVYLCWLVGRCKSQTYKLTDWISIT